MVPNGGLFCPSEVPQIGLECLEEMVEYNYQKISKVILKKFLTDFDDVLYNAALGQRHKRIVWRGARTKNWNGKLYSPGYIVNGNTIIDNLDTSANSSLDYFTANSAGVNNEQAVNTARFNIGYNKPQ